ncbi:MAG: nucleotidyltransferase family protein [Nodosilinea sp.]
MQIELPQAALHEFCQRHHIKKLSVFGSVLRSDFNAESDVDFLVEFDPHHIPGLIRLAGLELELSNLVHHKVDLRTPKDLSRYFRDDVLRTAVVQYDSAQ